jgi:hypothetical protein
VLIAALLALFVLRAGVVSTLVGAGIAGVTAGLLGAAVP